MSKNSNHATRDNTGFVYVVLAHSKHKQLLRLLQTIRASSPGAAILLHYDAKASLPDRALLDAINVRLVEPRHSVQWGDVSQVNVLLACIAYAVSNFDFEWLTIITGQDYPVRPLSIAETELRSSGFDAFVKAAPAAQYRSRYYLRYWSLPRFPYTHRLPGWVLSSLQWMRRNLNQRQPLLRIEGGPRGSPLSLGIFSRKHPFDQEFICYKGSDWFSLSHRAATYLPDFNLTNPAVLGHYRHTYLPSESYFQTVLWNAKDLKVCDDHRRFILWDDTKLAHPVTLTMQHFDAMISSGKDFGRKFDMDVDAEVLDRLDEVVLGPQQATIKRGASNVFPVQA
jgi:Core-2/I-Branching enzyme